MSRISKDDYYLEIAKSVSVRSTCLRAKAGAVIVNNDTIISTGYSGSARNEPNCSDIGECERDKLKIKPGTQYELCKSIHAEANAIINAARHHGGTIGARLYIYFERLDGLKTRHNGPCIMCSRMIKNAGISDIIFKEVI